MDTGLRPEECYRLMWESITWCNGRNGTLLVTHGKTKAARRVIPMTPRVRTVLEQRWESAEKPLEGWVWPAPTHSGHVEPSSLKKQHRKALRIAGVRDFVLYSLRHTFLTRLGESGCDACEDCWPQLDHNLSQVRTPFGKRSPLCRRKAGWAQNWAQSKSG